MQNFFVVGLGGFCGALARYSLSTLVCRLSAASSSLAGTLTVNAFGCLVMGIIAGLAESRLPLSPTTRLFLVVGVLGSFTTFSAVGYETFEFFRTGQHHLALLHAGGSLALALGAVATGWWAVRALGW